MRKDGRGHGDHDAEWRPITSTAIAIAAILVLGWALAGRPSFGLW